MAATRGGAFRTICTPAFFLVRVETGRIDAHMKVSLANDGPATFLLRS
ncbi:D-aminoacyl-tRNA deacylase [Luteimonas suaedae]